jgi:hypothetical protein
MRTQQILRSLIGEILNEAIDPSLLGAVAGKQAIVIGPNAKKFLATKGMSTNEINLVFERINNVTLEQWQRYDADFKKYGMMYGLTPSLLKAMAIEETSLGKNLANLQGSSAAGVIQITKPTLNTLNMNIADPNQHYDYNTLLSNAGKSIEIAARYIKEFLIGKKKLKGRPEILRAYKTGSDAPNYVIRVEAFKKFVDIVGL